MTKNITSRPYLGSFVVSILFVEVFLLDEQNPVKTGKPGTGFNPLY
ncbi:hypothetical protein PLACP1_06280 [Planifilum fimeticola]